MGSKDIVDMALKETGLEKYKKGRIDPEKMDWNEVVEALGAKIHYKKD